jgi:hypothetical protein
MKQHNESVVTFSEAANPTDRIEIYEVLPEHPKIRSSSF